MLRCSMLCLALFCLAGCQQNNALPSNPFLGSPRIAPPGTGTAGGNGAYYDPASQVTPSPAASGSIERRTSPDDQMVRLSRSETLASALTEPPPPRAVVATRVREKALTAEGDVVRISSLEKNIAEAVAKPAPVRTVSYEAKAKSGSSGKIVGATSPGNKSILRVVERDAPNITRGTIARTTAREPRRLDPPTHATEITDLPKADDNADDNVDDDAGKKIASGWSGGSAGVSKTAAQGVSRSTKGRYGFDADYGWLEGKLEYSQSAQRWKLRYIPIDGETDRYGGSVVLNGNTLDGYEHGDFIRVEGTVAGKDKSVAGFAPKYQFKNVARMASR